MNNDIDLSQIKSPADIRKMNLQELTVLAAEMRSKLLEKLSAHGGHIGPNLGMVEAIIALHYVFDTPEDKIVFDVSHQTYPHKMLTGRMEAFTDPAHYRYKAIYFRMDPQKNSRFLPRMGAFVSLLEYN